MKTNIQKKAILLLKDGTIYEGLSIGKIGTTTGEICFNTGMTGYQEIYSDPSYFGQIIVNTHTHIGNYGIHQDESESSNITIKGLVVRDFTFQHSRKSAYSSLDDYLKLNNTVGICGLDTRQIVKQIRNKGAMNALISSEERSKSELLKILEQTPSMENCELSSQVSTPSIYELGQDNNGHKIAVLDLGVKKSILTNFLKRNCKLRVFPSKTTFAEMQQWQPDAYFLTNGPGDPASMPYAIQNCKEIVNNNIPVFGICMGNQILALSQNIPTYKMHHGHRGLNHPVKNLLSNKCEITSQNHGFAVDMEQLKKTKNITLTHIDLNEGTVEGFKLNDKPAFAVQYHPESAPGPHDSTYLFDEFIEIINNKTIYK